MSLDMSQFYQVFFEETEEHLASIEAILLRIDPQHPAPEEIAEIFRAAHSIKGSSATFGFEDMAGVTHLMEDLLDRVRKGELALSREMVDACLAAGDVLRNQLDAHRGERRPDLERAEAVRSRLAELCDGAAPGAAPQTAAGPGFDLAFRLARVVSGSELLVDNMLAELAALGDCEIVERPGALQPEGGWRIRLRGVCAESALRGALELVTDPGDLTISPLAPASAVSAADRPALPAEYSEDAEDGSYTLFMPFPPAREAQPHGAAAELAAPAAAAGEAAEEHAAGATRGGAETSIRVSVDKVDQMVNLVGELVITRSILQEVASQVDAEVFDKLMNGLGLLERNTRELQESVMSIRMVAVSVVFARFPRLVRELGARLGKQVRLRLEGEHAELDKGLVERIADPLTHLVRNALDHGIETPAQRLAAGKPEEGQVVLRALHQGSYILIEVEDDGAGLSREKILHRARERGMAVHDGMGDAEVWQLICEPGFSTAETVTEVSGRGVGMDVVKRNIGALGGLLEIRSEHGRGTRIGVRLPLTLAIVDGLTVGVGEELYVIPLGFVAETLQAAPETIHRVAGEARMVRVRGDYLPVVDLGRRFAVEGAQRDWSRGIMVLVESNGVRAALFVDTLVDQQQVVIKNLEANFRRVAGFSAATVLGSGKVALILDVAVLVDGVRGGEALAA